MHQLDIQVGDCRSVIPQLVARHGKAKLLFADPPFNIGQVYSDYSDRMHTEDYSKFTTEWLAVCYAACDGILALHGPDALAEEYIAYARAMQWRRVTWINWAYNFGQCTSGNWIDARCHLLVYSVHAEYTWNPDAVLIESARVRYKDKRVASSNGARVPGTIWGLHTDDFAHVEEPLHGESYWGRVQGTNAERWASHPNQLPLRYLQRLVLAYTNPGDLVMDPFLGSGTTALVAYHEQRSFAGCDISPTSVKSATERIASGFYRKLEVAKKRG